MINLRGSPVFLRRDLIAETAKRGEVDLSLVSVDSTTRAHHDDAGMQLSDDVLTPWSWRPRRRTEAGQRGRFARAGRAIRRR